MAVQSIFDQAVRFDESMRNTLDYPVNLLRTEAFSHTLESYRRRLNSTNLFDPTYRSLACVNLYEKFDLVKNIDIRDHLDEDDGTPLWRMVYEHCVAYLIIALS